LHEADIKKLGVIHRGFSTYEKSKYRNNPEWQIAIELQSKFPDLPLINDPSHITGKRDMIFDVSQTALDLNFDGLMIETHYDPDNAWSDASQQVTPARLVQITEDLRIRKRNVSEPDYISDLAKLRMQIDDIDGRLIDQLGNRMKIADQIGVLKSEHNVAVLQSERWNEILGKMVLEGQEKGLSDEFIIKIFKAIHQESINHQEQIIKKQ
jgi:chorismate mutase